MTLVGKRVGWFSKHKDINGVVVAEFRTSTGERRVVVEIDGPSDVGRMSILPPSRVEVLERRSSP